MITRGRPTSVVVIPAEEVDRLGLHVCNIEGMRRALARLAVPPGVRADRRLPGARASAARARGLEGRPGRGCVAAASVLAKVTRDRIMAGLRRSCPDYDFLGHKGYVTPVHNAALDEHGPCAEHRFSYVNVPCGAWAGPAASAEPRWSGRTSWSTTGRRHGEEGWT